ncbi:ribbon-helix-helix domain-containing protein, partial [Cutibacterium acnes]|uniref:CopG family transcriptional regulator n=1 Tax=Cutibacterium acnes TaxID=1747 RepID=UPI0005C52055
AGGGRAWAGAGYPKVEAGRPTRAGTGRSQTGNLRPRQVRLDVVTDARLDDLATKTGRKPADIMRSAISAYLDAAGDTTVYLRDKSRER